MQRDTTRPMKIKYAAIILLMPFIGNCSQPAFKDAERLTTIHQEPFAMTAIYPMHVTYNSNEKIHVYGIGFEEGTEVFVGDVPAEYVTVHSRMSLSFILPTFPSDMLIEGAKSVTVRHPDGRIRPIKQTHPRKEEYKWCWCCADEQDYVDALEDENFCDEMLSDGLIYLNLYKD